MTTIEIKTQLFQKRNQLEWLLETLTPLSDTAKEMVKERLERWKKHPRIKDVRLGKNILHLDLINEYGAEYALEAFTGHRIFYAETMELFLDDIEYHLSGDIPSFQSKYESYRFYRNRKEAERAMEDAREADNLASEIDTLELLQDRYSTAATFSIGSYPESGDGINPYYHR